MKYILTIDTEKKEISVSLDRPIFLRTGDESLMELECRKRIFGEYKNATRLTGYMTRLPAFKESWKAKLPIRCVVIHHTLAIKKGYNESLHPKTRGWDD